MRDGGAYRLGPIFLVSTQFLGKLHQMIGWKLVPSPRSGKYWIRHIEWIVSIHRNIEQRKWQTVNVNWSDWLSLQIAENSFTVFWSVSEITVVLMMDMIAISYHDDWWCCCVTQFSEVTFLRTHHQKFTFPPPLPGFLPLPLWIKRPSREFLIRCNGVIGLVSQDPFQPTFTC